MENKNIAIYRAFVNDEDEITGIKDVSFVSEPAIESDFIALKNEGSELKLSVDSSKHILTGALLIPDKLIYRLDSNNNPYFITFSKEDIEKIAYKMIKQGNAIFDTSIEHDKRIKGNQLVECWIVNDSENDKANSLGLSVPDGTLMVSYKVNDEDAWNEVKAGKVKGFSLEGYFEQQKLEKIINKYNKENMKKNKESFFSKLNKFLFDIQTVQSADKTGSGEMVMIFQTYDGKEIQVDEDGYASIDGKDAPAGDQKLYDGNIITIDDSSMFQGTKTAEQTVTDPAQAVAAPTEQPTDTTQMAAVIPSAKTKCDTEVSGMTSGDTSADTTSADTTVEQPTEEIKEPDMEEPEQEHPDFGEMEQKIADMQAQIDAITAQLAESNSELAKKKQACEALEKENTELKKVTPSINQAKAEVTLNKTNKTSQLANLIQQIANKE